MIFLCFFILFHFSRFRYLKTPKIWSFGCKETPTLTYSNLFYKMSTKTVPVKSPRIQNSTSMVKFKLRATLTVSSQPKHSAKTFELITEGVQLKPRFVYSSRVMCNMLTSSARWWPRFRRVRPFLVPATTTLSVGMLSVRVAMPLGGRRPFADGLCAYSNYFFIMRMQERKSRFVLYSFFFIYPADYGAGWMGEKNIIPFYKSFKSV